MNLEVISNGAVDYCFNGNRITGLRFCVMQVADITPVRDFANLQSLTCWGDTGWGRDHQMQAARFSDLTPIKDMKLVELNCMLTFVADLSSLQGMSSLETLDISQTKIRDLSPLQGMKLTNLNCAHTEVSDLSPLRGMRLEHLQCDKTSVDDLSPLQGMPLGSLSFGNTRVKDLSALRGMPLIRLSFVETPVSDLSPLKGMRLSGLLFLKTQVSDLSPLAGMPLKNLGLDPELAKQPANAMKLKSLLTLERINGRPVAQFWSQQQKTAKKQTGRK